MYLKNLLALSELKRHIELIIKEEKQHESYDSTDHMYLNCAYEDLINLIKYEVDKYDKSE